MQAFLLNLICKKVGQICLLKKWLFLHEILFKTKFCSEIKSIKTLKSLIEKFFFDFTDFYNYSAFIICSHYFTEKQQSIFSSSRSSKKPGKDKANFIIFSYNNMERGTDTYSSG